MNFLKTYIKNHKLFLTLSFIIWLCASFWGIYFAFSAQNKLAKDVGLYISSLNTSQKGFWAIFKNGVLTNFKYCLFMSISSSFYILFPASLMLIGFKGFCAGFTSMFVVRLFGIKGALASLVSVVFPLFLSLPALFIMFAECMMNQALLFKRRKKLSSGERGEILFSHILKIIIIFIMLCAVSLLESALSPICIKLIS